MLDVSLPKNSNRPSGHLNFLDGMRGIAILGVFVFHALRAAYGMDKLPWAGMFRNFDASPSFLLLYPATYGNAGVAVFFVVSGFCIHLSYQRSKSKGWKYFFNQRFFRIYPIYLLATLVFFFIWPWGDFNLGNFQRITQLVSHILLIHNWGESTFYGINASFWSIAVEVQLYLIYPLLVWLTTRLGWRKSLVLAAVSEIGIIVGSSVYKMRFGDSFPTFITGSPFAFWLSWSFGAYLAECYLQGRTSRLFAARIELVAIVAILLPFFKLTTPFVFLSFAWLAAITIERLIVAKWSGPDSPEGLLGRCWSHLGALGMVSYSFYLIHQPMIGLTNRVLNYVLPGTISHQLLSFCVYVSSYPIVYFISLLIYKRIEQPSINFGKATWKKIESKQVS